ncbi:DUF3267 domain-containing protein [Sphingobacterium sp. DR205]|uniref:DUF3267 domain-containing protein n=1 Tax=Sphingobacterium sp. DR205 TaxID=2713573 RepID=UPI0013E4C246|nr:DUF3267 domain-containing protein [Sphingobacterium sp. DR205]QIH32281.1 DUF3267 domain-containing protein [Sphingobacterium sp. DR205]
MSEIENYPGYVVEPRLINLYKANVVGFLFFAIFILLYGLPFYLLWDIKESFSIMKNNIYDKDSNVWWVYVIIIVSGIVIHELIHGIVFAFFAKEGFKSIKFGVLWKMLTPYAHCKEPLQVRAYMLALVMPFIIVGLLPGIYSIFTGNLPLLLFAIFFSGAASGDFMILNLIYKENKDNLVLDHPTEGGCFVLKKVM